MKMISYKLALACMLLSSAAQAGPRESGILRAQGTKLVDQKGAEVRLRGFGLGNWLLPEGYMWKFYSAPGDRPRRIEAVVEKALGAAEARAFWKTYRDNYITETDIRRIAELGFNSVRPALKARDFLTEDSDPQWLEEGFQRVEQLVQWCRKHNLYVILDLHAAPGGQTGKNIDDSARDYPDLFEKAKYQEQTEQLWLKLASRYKDDPVVAGYDLLNEPLPDDFKHLKPRLEPLYKRLTKAIRKVDSKHLIILEGSNWANDWSVFGPPFDSNLMYQFHKYWNDPDRDSVRGYVDFQSRHQVPVWIGEFGESKVGTHWYWATTQLFEDLGWHWAFWPWKKLDTDSSPYSIRMPRDWSKIQQIANGGSAPPRSEARAILGEFLENLKMQNCDYVPDVIAALMRRVPARISAVDFGHQGEGRSFHVGDSGRRATAYRKGEPVRIEPLSGGEGYNVGWVQAGEWLEYPLEVEADGAYDFGFRVAADGGGKSFRLEAGGRDLSGEIKVDSTGGWTKWVIVEKKGIVLKKGPIKLRFFCTTGGYNLDYFYATKPGAAVPERAENLEMRRGKTGRLPGKVEGESFGPLGEGRSFHDTDGNNEGGALRTTEGVDVQGLDEGGGMAAVLEAGEWLNYEISSLAPQKLVLSTRVKSTEGARLSFHLDGKAVGQAEVKGPWIEKRAGLVAVPAGRHNLTVKLVTGRAALDWLELRP